MPQQRVLLGFTNAPDHTLEETAGAVIDGLYANPAFPTPPVAKPALKAALTAFTAAIAAQSQGGPAATADKNNKAAALVDLLRQLAAYVQDASDNDLDKLLSSGFDAISNNRSQSPWPPRLSRTSPTARPASSSSRSPPSPTPKPTKSATPSPRWATPPAPGRAAASSPIRAPCPSTASPPAPTTASKSARSAAALATATGAIRSGT